MSFSPTNISGLHFWLDANDASTLTYDATTKKVSEWRDKSVTGSPRKMELITYSNWSNYGQSIGNRFQTTSSENTYAFDETAWNYAFNKTTTKDDIFYNMDNSDISKNVVQFNNGLAVYNGGSNNPLFNDVSNSSGVTIFMLVKITGTNSASPFGNVFTKLINSTTYANGFEDARFSLFNGGVVTGLTGDISNNTKNIYQQNKWYIYTICGNPSFAPGKTLYYLNGHLILSTSFNNTYFKSPYMAGMFKYKFFSSTTRYRTTSGGTASVSDITILVRNRTPTAISMAELLAYKNTSTTDRFTYDNLVSVHNYLFNKWFALRNYPVNIPNNLVSSTLFRSPSGFGANIINKIIGSGFTLRDSNNNIILNNLSVINESDILSIDNTKQYKLTYTQNGISNTLNFNIVNLIDTTTLSKGAKIKFLDSSFDLNTFKTSTTTISDLGLNMYWDTSMNVNILSNTDTFLISSTSQKQIKFRLENNVDSETISSNTIDYIIISEQYIVIRNIGDSATLQLPASSISTIETYLGSPITAYQWYFNGTIMAGQTSSSITIPSSTLSNNGKYSLRVTYGGLETDIDTNGLYVIGPVTIDTASINTRTTNGTFQVKATPIPGATYEWFAESNTIATQANPYGFAATNTATTSYTFNSPATVNAANPRTTVATLTNATGYPGTYTIRSSNDNGTGFSGWAVLDTDAYPASQGQSEWAILGSNFAPGNSWWSLEFPVATKISRIDIGPRSATIGTAITNYIIQGSNDNSATWTNLIDVLNEKPTTTTSSIIVNIPENKRAEYKIYRILLLNGFTGSTRVNGTDNTYYNFGTTHGDVGMCVCKFYTSYGSLVGVTGYSNQTTDTLTAQIYNNTNILSGKYYAKITKNGVSITTKIPAYFNYNILNQGKQLPLLNDISNGAITSPTNFWYVNGIKMSSTPSTSYNATLAQAGRNVIVNTLEIDGTIYNQYCYVADTISALPSYSNAVNTTIQYAIADISQASYRWYKSNTDTGTTTLTYSTTEKNKYYASVTKYGLKRYTNVSILDFQAPLQIAPKSMPPLERYNILRNRDLLNNSFFPPLRMYDSTRDGRIIFVDNLSSVTNYVANIYITYENFLATYDETKPVTLLQVPYPTTTSTFAVIRWDTIQVAELNGQTIMAVKCKVTSGGAQFIQTYVVPKSSNPDATITLRDVTANSTLTADDDTANSSCFAYAGNGRYLFWKNSASNIAMYDLSNATLPSPTNITYSGTVKTLTVSYNARVLCLTSPSSTASTEGYRIMSTTDTTITSGWAERPALHAIGTTGSMTNQILLKISNRTAANTSTNVSTFSPATLQYSMATSDDMSTLYLYVPAYTTGNNRGVFAVFNYNSGSPTLRYFFYPQAADVNTYFSTNSANPYFINGPYLYKIPTFYLSKISPITGLDVSGADLSPVAYIRNRVDISNNMPLSGNAISVATSLMVMKDGGSIVAHNRDYQIPGNSQTIGGFSVYDIANVVPGIRQPNVTQTHVQLERTENYNQRNIRTDFLNNTYLDTSNTYVFVKPANVQGSINTLRNTSRYSAFQYTTDNTQGIVGKWNVRINNTSVYPLNNSQWYSLKTDLSYNYFFSVNAGVNFDSQKNAADPALTLEYFVDPEVIAVSSDISNAAVNIPDASYISSKTKNTTTVTINQVAQQPDTLNSVNPITTVAPLYDVSASGVRSRIIYRGYPSILKNTLIKDDPRYVFDTDDLIRWFNPSISKEYVTPDISYEYGWAVRITRGSAASTANSGITWGWQASADGGTTWRTLGTTTTGSDTYFFKNKVPGTEFKYKFRYIDEPGSTQLGAAVASKYLDSFLVLPWNEENENITTGTYLRDETDYSTTSGTNYRTAFTHYIGKLYDGSGNNVANGGDFANKAGIVRVDISASARPVFTNPGIYEPAFSIIDNNTDPSGVTISELFYGASPYIRIGTASGPNVDLVDPDISSNQMVLGIAIDLSTINTGTRGTWQYMTDVTSWTNMTNNASNALVLWSRDRNDANNRIRFKPVVNKRETPDYETLRFYVYDGSDVQTDQNNQIVTATNKNGTITNTVANLKSSGVITDASGQFRIFVDKFNFSPEIENPATYNIEYKYNSSTYTANGQQYLVPTPNVIGIPISDLTGHYIPRDLEYNTLGLGIGDISNVPLIAGEPDVSNNYYGPYNLGGAAYTLDISNGNYASFIDASSQPTLYSISSVTTSSLNTWFDMNNYKDSLVDSSLRVESIPNRVTGTRTLSQTTNSAKPTYVIDSQGYKGLRFNGAQWLDICGAGVVANNMAINSTSQTLIVVERREGSGRAPFIGGSGAADFSNIEFGYSADGSGVIFSAEGSTANAARACNSTAVVNSYVAGRQEPIRIWTYQYDDQTTNATKTVRIYLNDQLLTTTSITAPAATTQFTGITTPSIGRAIKGATTNYYTGIIYEFAYFNAAIVAATVTSVQQNLMQKYGLLDSTTPLRHGIQAWYDFARPTTITYNADTKVISAVKNRHGHLPALALSSAAGPVFTADTFIENTKATFNGGQSFDLTGSPIVGYFTGAYAVKSYTLIIVDNRAETSSAAAGFLGTPSSSQFYIGYDSSQNMVIKSGANSLVVSALNITYNATRVWTFTYDAVAGRYEIYMNGFKLGSKAMSLPSSWTDAQVFGQGYRGTIGEVVLYNVVIKPSNTTDAALYTTLYGKWLKPTVNAASSESLRCYGWYDVTDTTLLDLSSSSTTISTVYNKNTAHSTYTLTQTTEANKPLYNASETAIQFVDARSSNFTLNGIVNATDSDRSHTILIVEKRSAVFDVSGAYRPAFIIGNQLNFGYENNTGLQYNNYDIPGAVLPFNQTAEPRRLWTLSYDGSTRKTRVYLNNELVFDKTDAFGSALTWTTRLIGALSTTTGFYNGFIYEMMFFNDAAPTFLGALQAKLMDKWSIPAAYINPTTVCWVDVNDPACVLQTGLNVYSLTCKSTGTEIGRQDTNVNQPVIQSASQPSILGKKALYFSGSTSLGIISTAYTNTFLGTSYTFIWIERRDQTANPNTVLGNSQTGFGIYFDLSGTTRRLNYRTGASTVQTVALIPNYNYLDQPTSVWTITYSGSTLTVFQNTTRIAVIPNVTRPTAWTSSTLGAGFKGYICELMLFNSASVSNLADIQERLVEKWVVGNIDAYMKYYPIMGWYDMADANCIDLSGTTSTVYRLSNRNTLNAHMNFVQTSADANCPTYNAAAGSITFGASKFMMMSPYLRDQMLTTSQAYPRSFTIILVEKRNATGVHHFIGDVLSSTAGQYLNIGYGSTDASGILINTGTLRSVEHAASYVNPDAKKVWTYAFVYNPAAANTLRCNVYLNNIYLGYTNTSNNLTAWSNPCIGRHLSVYSNFDLFEMVFLNDGSVENISAIQEALAAKHGITFYSVPRLGTSNAIQTSDVNTGLVALFDSADLSTVTIQATKTVDISGITNKVTTNPQYRLDISSAATSPTIGNIINDISGIVFSGSTKLIRMSADMAALFVGASYTVILVERRGAATANYIVGSPATGRLSIGYSGASTFAVGHSAGSPVSVTVLPYADATNEPVRIWTIAYNNTAQTVDIYLNNQRVVAASALSSNSAAAELTLGRSAATYYNGTLYEMWTYNSYVNDVVALKTVQERLMSKWKVRLSTHFATSYSEPGYYMPSSLVGWFDAAALVDNSGTAVSEIPNRVAKYAPYFTMRQTVVANQPSIVTNGVNGRNVVRFNRAASNFMDISSVAYAGDTNTRFANLLRGSYTLVVVERSAANGSVNPFIGGNGTVSGAGNNVMFGYNDISQVAFTITNNSTSYTKTYATSYSAGQIRIWTFINTGSTYSLYLNGTFVESTSGSVATSSLPPGLAFGRYKANNVGAATNYYSGDFCEMMLFNTSAVPDIDKYHKYLMDKWGISASAYYPNNYGMVAWFDMSDRSSMSTGSSFISHVNNKLTNYPQYYFSNNGDRASRPKYVGGAVNSLNCLQFNPIASSTQFMNVSPDLAALIRGGEFTMMVVEKRTSVCDARPFFGGSSATAANNVVVGYGAVTAGTSQAFGLTTGTAHTVATSLNFIDISKNHEQAHVWTFEVNSTPNILIYHNSYNFINTGLTRATNWIDPYIGRNRDTYYNGYICEIMIFNKAGLANRTEYEKYLYNKWVGDYSYSADYTGGGAVSVYRWFDLTDKTTIRTDATNNITNINSKLIQHLPSQTGSVGSLIVPNGSTGPKYVYNAFGKINACDFSGNALRINNIVSGENFEALVIVVEKPIFIPGKANTVMNSSGGGASWSMGYNSAGNPFAQFSLNGTTTYNNYRLNQSETPHVWMFTNGIYKMDPKISCYFDGQAIVNPTVFSEGDNDNNKLLFHDNFRLGNGYIGHIYEVIIGNFTQAANLDGNFISRFSKYLINKWSVVKPSLTIGVNQNQTQQITMKVAAWDILKRSSRLPASRAINSAYSEQLANLVIKIYNQNRCPVLNFDGAQSLLAEGNNTVRVFDLTTIPAESPLGLFENKLRNNENTDIPGTLILSINNLFQNTLDRNYTERDTRDNKGIALVGINTTRGTWYLYNNDINENVLNLNQLGISANNALLIKQNTGYSLRYDVSSTFIRNPHQASFDIIAWDATDERYSELSTVDLAEETWSSTSSYSDPSKIYRYNVKSRPFIENEGEVIFEITYDINTQFVQSNEKTLADISSSFYISTPLAGSNQLYITDFLCSSIDGSPLKIEYKAPSGNWVDLSATDANPVLATYPLRLKTSTIDDKVIERVFEFKIKVRDTNVDLVSSSPGKITMKVTEINIAPTIKYKNALNNPITYDSSYTLPLMYNNVTSAEYPEINIANNFQWVDNNFSIRYRNKAFAISVINSANGIWKIIDNENRINQNISNLGEGQRFLLAETSNLRYEPSPNSNGRAIVALYAWDRGAGDGEIGQIISPNDVNVRPYVYEVGLFSDEPVIITIPVASPNIAPKLEKVTSDPLIYDLTEQTDDNTNVQGNTIESIVGRGEVVGILGSDYVETYINNEEENKGIAVVGMTYDASYGVWQYSLNADTTAPTWTGLTGTYSNSRALLLAGDEKTAVRFRFTKTDGFLSTYVAPTLTIRAWDQTDDLANGSITSIQETGGNAPYSVNTATLNCPIRHINHAPRLSAADISLNYTVVPGQTHTVNIAGIISALGAKYIDEDIEDNTRGVSIIQITSTFTRNITGNLGRWAAVVDGNEDELNVVTSSFKLLTTDIAKSVTFRPEEFNTGATTLVMKLYDGELESVRTLNYVVTIGDVNYAPRFNDTTIQNVSYGPTLFGTTLSLNVSQVVTDLSCTDFNGDNLGLVVFDSEPASSYNAGIGKISYKTRSSDSTFTDLPVSKLSGSAIHLTHTGVIRYQPVLNVDGATTSINVLLWDQSNTATLPSTYSGVTARGGNSAYSVQTVRIDLSNIKQNYAPEISGATVTLQTLEAVATSTSYSIRELIETAAIDYKDSNWTTDQANSRRGLAIHSVDTYAGVWEYTIDDGASWTTLTTTAGSAAHFIESETTKVRYRSTTNVTDYGAFSVVGWDGTNYQGSTYPYVAQLPVTASRGGTTSYSANSATFRVDVTYVNNRPVFTSAPGSISIGDVPGYSVDGSVRWVRIGDISGIFDLLVDPDAALLKRGSVKEKPTVNYGVVVFEADNTSGKWYYSNTNQTTLGNLEINPSIENGYILTKDTYIRFDPAFNRDISNIVLKCRGIASGGTIQATYGGKDIREKESAAQEAASDYTATSAEIVIEIVHINKAPTLVAGTTSLYTLPTIYGDSIDNADNSGVSVKDIMDSVGFVSAYADADIADGIVPDTQRGIVLAERSGTATGTWQYKLSAADISWSSIGAAVTSAMGLPLSYSDDVRLRFLPSKNETANAVINVYAWDKTTGTSGTLLNINQNVGDPKSISTNYRTVDVGLVYMNHSPSFTKVSVNAVVTPGNNEDSVGTLVRNILDVSGLDFNDRDIQDSRGFAIVGSSIPADLSGNWQYRESGGAWTDIVLNGVYFLRDTNSATRIRFYCNANPPADQTATLTVKAWDGTEFTNNTAVSAGLTTSSTSLSSATATISFLVEKINYVPNLEGTITYTPAVVANTTFTQPLGNILTLFSLQGNDRAIAIVAQSTGGKGTWSYSVGGGAYQTLTIGSDEGLVLNETDNVVLRYVNTSNTYYNPSIGFYLVDRGIYNDVEGSYPTTGQRLTSFSTIPKGGTNYISAANATFRLSIVQYTVAPVVAKPAAKLTGARVSATGRILL